MNIPDFVLNWIIFRPHSMKKWIFKTYRPGLLVKGIGYTRKSIPPPLVPKALITSLTPNTNPSTGKYTTDKKQQHITHKQHPPKKNIIGQRAHQRIITPLLSQQAQQLPPRRWLDATRRSQFEEFCSQTCSGTVFGRTSSNVQVYNCLLKTERLQIKSELCHIYCEGHLLACSNTQRSAWIEAGALNEGGATHRGLTRKSFIEPRPHLLSYSHRTSGSMYSNPASVDIWKADIWLWFRPRLAFIFLGVWQGCPL